MSTPPAMMPFHSLPDPEFCPAPNVRAKHVKKLAKVLAKSKVLRFAQVESRLDLALRLQMASAVPLVPTSR